MKGIFSVLVENKAGVLSKTAGLFARRGFNIDSLAVGETDDRDISSMTIISTGDLPKIVVTQAGNVANAAFACVTPIPRAIARPTIVVLRKSNG